MASPRGVVLLYSQLCGITCNATNIEECREVGSLRGANIDPSNLCKTVEITCIILEQQSLVVINNQLVVTCVLDIIRKPVQHSVTDELGEEETHGKGYYTLQSP